MVSKVFLGIALVSSIAFTSIFLFVGRNVEGALHRATRDSALQMAGLVRSSLEQAMLSGNGIKVKRLVEELKASVVQETEIHIYDSNGIEVFAPPTAVPNPGELDVHVAEVLRERARVVSGNQIVRAVPMEERCSRDGCHDSSDALRGVLSMRVRAEACQEGRDQVVSEIVRRAFIHLMTARQATALDGYFAEISLASPSIRAVAVYDNEGDPSFGRDMAELGVSGEVVLEAMSHGDVRTIPMESGTMQVLPLIRESRCIECHEQEEKLRGALLVALAPSSLAPSSLAPSSLAPSSLAPSSLAPSSLAPSSLAPSSLAPSSPAPSSLAPSSLSASGCNTQELETLIDTSLRHIMTSELGRIIARFLDSIVETDAVEELVLYDKDGRIYWNTSHAQAPEHVARVLSTQKGIVDLLGEGEMQRIRVVEPLENSSACARCHGTESPLRGLVEVSLSTRMAAQARAETKRFVMATTALAVLSMFLVLIVLLQLIVIRPVREISSVASSIGDGDLEVRVQHADNEGDEVARLGDGINAMIGDLRTKFHLEKFVSKGAAKAARSAGARALSSEEGGERTEATILFSDIRGFTSYSEEVEAEQVVAMLNRLLRAQTVVVHEFAGDVDKFVGDELMAVFQGDDATHRATSCALAMIDAIHAVRETDLTVGIGISTGEVVMGAIGHEDRLDFTVIGDVVNVGARLCSAAKGDQVLVTQAVEERARDNLSCKFHEIDPIAAKGKKHPLVVYEVSKPD